MKYLITLGFGLASSALAAAATPAYTDLWQLQQEALAADPRLLRAQALQRSGEGRQREAYGQLLPQLSATASTNRSRRDDNLGRTEYNGKRVAMNLSQIIYDPQVWRSYQKFVQLARQREFEADDAQVQASIDLAERYFAVLAAEDELSLVSSELQATRKNLAQLEALLAKGWARVPDRDNMRARVDTLAADEINARNQIAIAREAISEQVGRDVLEPLKPIADTPSFSLPAQDQDYWVETALRSNPGILARERGLSAAEAAVAEAEGGHLPRLGLNLSALRSDIGYEGTLTPRSDNYVASLDLQVPLYSGGSTSARIASSGAERDAAQQELETLRREVRRETRSAYLTMGAELSRIKASRIALVSAQVATRSSQKTFDSGYGTAIDVLYSVREEFRAKRDLNRAQYRFITGLLTLHRWSGQLTDSDVRRANDWLVIPHQ
ncbi:TolC family outer membrane protein [Pseudomonas guariconensis]|uniref:TolC family outer membrane protein n=1 Tax=Pseudomonas guariconensis TaxID=1288410 RepID=UPI0018ABEBD6|nr:TolC family outer membrane protein [Pseudomonas guariconensis]MBF8728912.1 TolC family outer membrane protein [Pseudomonas guariconensis]